jgi:hypothetical protein
VGLGLRVVMMVSLFAPLLTGRRDILVAAAWRG